MRKVFGFTLLEMLVVVGIVALALPAVFAIVFAIVRQQSKIAALKQVKREGDFILNAIENTIRSEGVGVFTDPGFINEVCDRNLVVPSFEDDGANFFFRNKSDAWFRYFLTSGSIASESANNVIFLTTDDVSIANFALSCVRNSAFSPPVVSVAFDIFYSASEFLEDAAQLHYQTQVQMKNL